MTGIEKITQRIAGDAQQEAAAVVAQAQAQADEIMARYQAQAQQNTQDALAKGRKQADEREYIDLLAQLTAKASSTGKEQLILCLSDRARYGVKIATRANDLLAKAGKEAHLTLSQQSRDFRGGVVLADGDVEVNCTFETLVRLARGSVSGEVAKVLFA